MIVYILNNGLFANLIEVMKPLLRKYLSDVKF